MRCNFRFSSIRTLKTFVMLCLCILFCMNPLFSKTVLDPCFKDFFPREIFRNFPVMLLSISDKTDYLEEFNRELGKISGSGEEYEIKLAFKPLYLPSIAGGNESETYKYRDDFSMRFFNSENSTVAIQSDPNGILTKIFKTDDRVQVRKYDEHSRLYNELTFISEKNEMVDQVYYFFASEDSKLPYYSIDKNYSEKKISKIEYTDKFFVGSKIVFGFSSYDEESDDDIFTPRFKKKNFISEEYYEYDDKNRIVKSIEKKGNYIIKSLFDYSKELRNPDETVYENDVKKTEKIFSSDENYSYEVFLNSGYSVKTVYKNYLIAEEQFYRDGELLRTNRFDKAPVANEKADNVSVDKDKKE